MTTRSRTSLKSYAWNQKTRRRSTLAAMPTRKRRLYPCHPGLNRFNPLAPGYAIPFLTGAWPMTIPASTIALSRTIPNRFVYRPAMPWCSMIAAPPIWESAIIHRLSWISMRRSACSQTMPSFLQPRLAYEKSGDNQRALADYSQAIHLDPNFFEPLITRDGCMPRPGISATRSRTSQKACAWDLELPRSFMPELFLMPR